MGVQRVQWGPWQFFLIFPDGVLSRKSAIFFTKKPMGLGYIVLDMKPKLTAGKIQKNAAFPCVRGGGGRQASCKIDGRKAALES